MENDCAGEGCAEKGCWEEGGDANAEGDGGPAPNTKLQGCLGGLQCEYRACKGQAQPALLSTVAGVNAPVALLPFAHLAAAAVYVLLLCMCAAAACPPCCCCVLGHLAV